MQLSEQLADYAASRFDARRPLLGEKGHELDAALQALPIDDAVLARYFCATLPLTDVFDTPFDVLAAHARHALMLRESRPETAALPEDVFVHYVACPRVNNEPLDRCREALWEALAPRVAGLAAERAVIEVNYWCAEVATYQTTDGRTLGALGVIAGAAGRCGEESTLLVSALRAVGIPARQLYVPWWAHCDDNHAWVEAYAGGRWHYLGACEPEEALDRGWFTAASGRAPMVATRLFSDFGCAPEDVLMRSGCSVTVGVTQSYAESSPLEVRVLGADERPAAGATVSLEVLNMAGWRPLVTLTADDEGDSGETEATGQRRVWELDPAEGYLGSRTPRARALATSAIGGVGTAICCALILITLGLDIQASVLAAIAIGAAGGIAPQIGSALVATGFLMMIMSTTNLIAVLPAAAVLCAIFIGWWYTWGRTLGAASAALVCIMALGAATGDPLVLAGPVAAFAGYFLPAVPAAISCSLGVALSRWLDLAIANGGALESAAAFASLADAPFLAGLALIAATAAATSAALSRHARNMRDSRGGGMLSVACALAGIMVVLLLCLANPMEIASVDTASIAKILGAGALSSIIIGMCVYLLGYRKDIPEGDRS